MGTAATSPQQSYAIAGGEAGKRRLDLLAEIMRPTTLRLLADVGLHRNDQCIDIGCGGGHVTVEMARIVGPKGRAVGIDFDPEIVELACRGADDAGLGNVEFVVGDARTVEGGPFDLAYARFLLSHVSEPGEVIGQIKDLVRPGGMIVLEDTDFTGCYCHPRDPAYDRYLGLYTEAVSRGGGDANLGRRLPALALEAGIREARWNVFQPVHASGTHKQIMSLTMEKLRPAVLRHGLVSEDEIDAILARMRTFAEDPTTLVAMPRMVQVWGQP